MAQVAWHGQVGSCLQPPRRSPPGSSVAPPSCWPLVDAVLTTQYAEVLPTCLLAEELYFEVTDVGVKGHRHGAPPAGTPLRASKLRKMITFSLCDRCLRIYYSTIFNEMKCREGTAAGCPLRSKVVPRSFSS